MEMVETARADGETRGHCATSCLCGLMSSRARYGDCSRISSNHLLNANDNP